MNQQGGYSGPQLFNGTLDLVKRYRRALDEPLHAPNESQQGQLQNTPSPPHPPSSSSPSSTSSPSYPQTKLTPKIIFCTGGIENGEQALEVLKAGASVAQIYSKPHLSTLLGIFANSCVAAMVYGGVGKITAMKEEMREVMRKEGAAGGRGR